MAKTRKPAQSIYSPHPSIKMVQDWIVSLPTKTGRSLEQWMAFIKKEGPTAESDRTAWLRKTHGLGAHIAAWLAERSFGKNLEDEDPELYLATCPRLVDAMYAGKKAALRPMHDRLIELGRSIAADVQVCPCKTIVPLYRNHVIAQVKPSTNTRIDFGLSLGDPKTLKKTPKRLIDTGGFAKKDRITHKFEITSMDDIDGEVEAWLKKAYERDA